MTGQTLLSVTTTTTTTTTCYDILHLFAIGLLHCLERDTSLWSRQPFQSRFDF